MKKNAPPHRYEEWKYGHRARIRSMDMNELEEKQELTLPKQKKKFRLGKKGRVAVVLLALVILAAAVLPRLGGAAGVTQAGYTVEQAARRDLSVSVSGSATLEPADSYQVNTLISGAILSAPFEEDDLVEQGALLYELDSGDARNSVSRAGLSVQQARLSYDQAKEAQHPTVPISGTISEVFVHNGDDVTAGTALAKITASLDLTIDFLFPYVSPGEFYVGQKATIFVGSFAEPVSGTVAAVSNSTAVTSNGMEGSSVRVKVENPGVLSDSYTASAVIGSYTSYGKAAINMPASATVYASGSGCVSGFDKLMGSTVTKGEVLCTVDSAAIRDQIENARLSLESANLSASSASGSLDDYKITSPISGTVIEKNFKAGDKVDGSASGTLAVIYDLSCLKMQMNVNELDIGKVKVSQTVDITAAALPGEVYTGTVERVSVNGATKDGFTTYPVTITIPEFGGLMPGMNVSASIRCDTAKNVLTVPVAAVNRGSTVLVAPADALGEGGSLADPARLEERAVTLGRSNDAYIEITSGLTEADRVAYQAAPVPEG